MAQLISQVEFKSSHKVTLQVKEKVTEPCVYIVTESDE